MILFQYQGNAVPLGAATRERATPDKWMPEHFYPRPNFRPDVKGFTAAHASNALSFTPATPFGEAPNAAKFYTQSRDPRFDVVRKQHTYPVEVGRLGLRNAFPADWGILPNQPIFDKKRTQHTYPSLFFSQRRFTEIVSADRWRPEIAIPVRRKPVVVYQHPGFVPLGKGAGSTWFSATNIPVLRNNPTQHLHQASINAFVTREIINVDKWVPLPNVPRFDNARVQALYPSFTFDPRPFPSPVFADTWHPDSNKPLFDLKRMQYAYPFKQDGPVSTTFKENTSVDRWYQEPEFPRRAITSTYAYSCLSEIPFRSNVLVIASWLPAQALPQFVKQTRISPEVSFVGVVINATPTGWLSQTELPVVAKKTNSTQTTQTNAVTQPRATFAYWYGSAETPVRSRYRDYLSQDRATYNLSNPVVGPGFATSTVGFANKASGDVTASGNATSTSSPLWIVKSTTGEPNV